MDYNNNTYVTILTSDAILLGVNENKRKSNDENQMILEFHENQTIPQQILNVVISTMTHQEALSLMDTSNWLKTMPIYEA